MEYRTLYSHEFEAWLDHVTTVFFADRQYFSNHWYNDPWKDLEGIRVAVDDGKIVSTVRVIIRKMFFHGETITVGGIGEVSTRSEYRRKGIATQLILDSIQFMEDRNIAISMLHGRQRIYSDKDWVMVPRYYAKKTFIGKKQQKWNVRPVNFQDVDEVQQLASIYDNYSRKFNGTFVRDSIEYWKDWVKTESPNAWIAEQDGKIDGYVFVKKGNKQMGVKEFAVSEELYNEGNSNTLFNVLLSEIIEQMGEERFEVEFPAPIADGFNTPSIEAHESTMYRVIQPNQFPEKVRHDLSDALPDLIHSQTEQLAQDIQSHHIFWQTDGF